MQLREKLADGGHFLAEAKAVIEVAHQHGVCTACRKLVVQALLRVAVSRLHKVQ